MRAANTPAGNISRENKGQNSQPASISDQIIVPINTTAKILTPNDFFLKIKNAETNVKSPEIMKYHDPPNVTNFTPPTVKNNPVRSKASPKIKHHIFSMICELVDSDIRHTPIRNSRACLNLQPKHHRLLLHLQVDEYIVGLV